MAERCLGQKRECVFCQENRVFALERTSNPKVCTECKRRMKGQAIMDQHHIAGKANSDITISIPANDHRAWLSEAQKNWPEETLQNKDGSPLLAAAACLRGLADIIAYLIEQFLLWVADLLEALNAYLTEQHGRGWWRNTPVEKFADMRRRNHNAKRQL
jgi:hypothetical protein